MSYDQAKYRPIFEKMGLPNDKLDELMRHVWFMMKGFADRAWGLDPIQICKLEAAKKDSNFSESSPESIRTLSANFNNLSGLQT